MIEIVLSSAAVVFAYMMIIFAVASIIKDNSIVDIGWGFGFVVVAVYLAFIYGDIGTSVLQAIVTTLVTAWGLRLGGHILTRKKGKSGWKAEDFRYAAWRKDWKNFYVRSFLQIYMLQGFLMLVISAPLFVAEYQTQRHINGAFDTIDSLSNISGLLLAAGLAVWLIGFVFEALGDYQLKKFLADKKNKGKIMRYGLWSLTRHPNYFGELTMWWGVWLIVLSYSFGFAAIISPIVITFLLLKVSGVTMLEKKWDKNKAYQAYKAEVPAIFPIAKP